MEQKDFIRRILENGHGNLSREDRLALEAWKAKSDDNRVFAESFERTLDLTDDFGKNLDFDASKAFDSFKQRISDKEVIPLTTSPRRSFLKIAAALAVLVAIVSALWFNQTGINSDQMASVSTLDGESLTLVDQSKVLLNKNTTLEHFTSLNTNNRKVNLEGEAFFDVERMVEKPFLIKTDAIQIEVLGTSFNVRDYKSENESLVFVKSGKVKVSSLSNPSKKMILNPGQQAIFNKKTGKFRKADNETSNAMSWIEGKLSFKKTKLKYALRDIERYFNISIDLKNKDLADCPYTSLFNAPSKEPIIETIAATFNMQIKQNGDSDYILSGGSCE